MKKVTVILLTGLICLLGATALAYQEAPMLRTLVAAGELPPVEERLPEDFLIVEPGQMIAASHDDGIVMAKDVAG